MAGQRVGETGLSESGPSSHHVPYGVLHGINTSASGLMYSLDYFSISAPCPLEDFLRHMVFLHFYIYALF